MYKCNKEFTVVLTLTLVHYAIGRKPVVASKTLNKGDSMCNVINRFWLF